MNEIFYVGNHHRNQEGWKIIAQHEVEEYDLLIFQGSYLECEEYLRVGV